MGEKSLNHCLVCDEIVRFCYVRFAWKMRTITWKLVCLCTTDGKRRGMRGKKCLFNVGLFNFTRISCYICGVCVFWLFCWAAEAKLSIIYGIQAKNGENKCYTSSILAVVSHKRVLSKRLPLEFFMTPHQNRFEPHKYALAYVLHFLQTKSINEIW